MTKTHPNFKMQNYLSGFKNTQRINKQDIQEHSNIFVINYTEWSSKQYNIIWQRFQYATPHSSRTPYKQLAKF